MCLIDKLLVHAQYVFSWTQTGLCGLHMLPGPSAGFVMAVTETKISFVLKKKKKSSKAYSM